MSRRPIFLVTFGCLILAGVLVCGLHKPNRPTSHLKITKQAIDQGGSPTNENAKSSGPFRLRLVKWEMENGPVVFFRVDCTDNRRFEIWCCLVKADNGIFKPYIQGSPVGRLAMSKKEFGVAAWTNAPCWKLCVGIHAEKPDLGWRVNETQTFWRVMQSNGASPLQATSSALSAFYGAESYMVDSDFITNSVVPEVSSSGR